MRILILCDLEGTAGVIDFKTQTYDGGARKARGRIGKIAPSRPHRFSS